MNRVIYEASFFTVFSSEIIWIVCLAGFAITGFLFIRRDGTLGNPGHIKYYNAQQKVISKIGVVWMKVSLVIVVIAAVFMAVMIAEKYTEGLHSLTFKINKKQMTKHISRRVHKSYTYKLDSDIYPNKFFEVNKDIYSKIKEGNCYMFTYYGRLSYKSAVNNIKEIAESESCN